MMTSIGDGAKRTENVSVEVLGVGPHTAKVPLNTAQGRKEKYEEKKGLCSYSFLFSLFSNCVQCFEIYRCDKE